VSERTKRRLFVVGGRQGRNVPVWLQKVFDIEIFEGEEDEKQKPKPEKKPDAIIVLSSWISHKHFHDARTLADELDVPFVLSPGGWSAAINSAITHGIDWFVRDIEAAKAEIPAENPTAAVESLVDSAWHEAYNREWAKNQALERRLRKTEEKLERITARQASAQRREDAAERVIAEVREAARLQRERLEKATAETEKTAREMKERQARLAALLADHFTTMKALLQRVSNGEEILLQAANMMSETHAALDQRTAILMESLTQPIATPSLTNGEAAHISQAREVTTKRK
jgi:hypothetical protein